MSYHPNVVYLSWSSATRYGNIFNVTWTTSRYENHVTSTTSRYENQSQKKNMPRRLALFYLPFPRKTYITPDVLCLASKGRIVCITKTYMPLNNSWDLQIFRPIQRPLNVTTNMNFNRYVTFNQFCDMISYNYMLAHTSSTLKLDALLLVI